MLPYLFSSDDNDISFFEDDVTKTYVANNALSGEFENAIKAIKTFDIKIFMEKTKLDMEKTKLDNAK